MIAQLLDYSQCFFRPTTHELHLHHFYQCDIVLEGTVQVWSSPSDYRTLHAGEALLIPPLNNHGYSSKNGFLQTSVKFYMDTAYWAVAGRHLWSTSLPNEYIKVVQDAGDSFLAQRPFSQAHLSSVISSCLFEMIAQRKKNENHTDETIYNTTEQGFHLELRKLIEEMHNSPYENWSVENMAAQCGLSTGYFSKQFFAVVQQTPQQFLLEIKMRNAAKDLRGKKAKTIKHLARLTGYASVHGFTRAFTQVFGQSPGAYRRATHTL